MKGILFGIIFLLSISAQSLYGQVLPKSMDAVRTGVKPVIDGEIDDIFFQKSKRAHSFTTLNPTPGVPSDFNTDV